jgi:transposase
MAAKAIRMEQLKQILRLKQDGFSIKAIARTTGIARNTIKKYLSRIDTDNTARISNKEIARTAFDTDTTDLKSERYTRLLEHLRYGETHLNKTGVTRQLLWLEYKEQNPDGYNYSQYCYHFNEFLRHKEVVMHLEHASGEKIMIDFAGKHLSYVDSNSGEVIPCQVFIAVLPHSGLIFCYAVHTQSTYDFITCINSMLKYYGGVTQTIVCDNLKTAVTRPSRYEPVFTDMLWHYLYSYTSL